jgi:hypothetical protein
MVHNTFISLYKCPALPREAEVASLSSLHGHGMICDFHLTDQKGPLASPVY